MELAIWLIAGSFGAALYAVCLFWGIGYLKRREAEKRAAAFLTA